MKITINRCLILCSAILLLTACAKNETTPTAVSQAVTEAAPTATDTVVPTNTSTPTPTAVPTDTPAPTDTPSPEPTATNTTSPTPLPTDTDTPEPTATATQPPPTATVSQSTATPTTAVPVSAPVSPPAAPAPVGPNMLANPGFEAGNSGWDRVSSVQGNAGNAQFIRSGEYSAFGYADQIIHDVVPGTTYRVGAWVKMWSSTGEDRSISENPGDIRGRVCINTNGNNDPLSNVCSDFVQSLDTWRYISVDAVASENPLKINLQATVYGDRPLHNEVYWDDVELGLAPVAATATPLPTLPPSRPAPIPFNASALRDNMTFVRSQIEQMGGVLDRMYNGQSGKCSEYLGYYNALITSPIYDGIPTEWQNIYNDYIFAVENTLATNEALKSLCTGGGGQVTELNYGAARQGINNSLDRLIPAIEAANALLGG